MNRYRRKRRVSFYVYMVRCKNRALYTGTARNLKERIFQHNNGTGAKYTRAFGPVKLMWSVKVKNRSLACRIESKIKKLDRKKKLALVHLRFGYKSIC